MSQHDLSIANQGFPAFRSDLNDALQALGSMQSGTTAPSTTYANMLWYDTTNNIVKMRNEDNDAWISLFTLDQSGDLVSEISAGKFIGTDTTDASSTTAAAVKTAGGLAVAKKLYVGTGGAVVEGLTVGKGAGAVSTNTAVGASALAANTTGTRVIAVGYQAALSNTEGTENVAIGAYCFDANTTGSANTAIGDAALSAATTASNNTAIGSESLKVSTTGAANTAVGKQSLFSNTTASNNTAVGYQAGYANTTGAITAVGYFAGRSNTTATNNTAIGTVASYLTTTGGDNTSLGYAALYLNSTGGSNTAIGSQALLNTTASSNTAVGYQAGYTNATGAGQAFFGYQTGYSATGGYNTFIGNSAGYYVTSGTKNTILGRYDGNQGGLDIRTASNYIVLSDGDGNPRIVCTAGGSSQAYVGIGTNGVAQFSSGEAFSVSGGSTLAAGFVNNETTTATVYVKNLYGDGGTSTRNLMTFVANSGNRGTISTNGNTTTYGTTSDYRLKENVQPMVGAIEKLSSLNPVTYTWKESQLDGQGFLAHELQAVFPDAVAGDKDAVDVDGNPVYQNIDQSFLVATLVAAIKELNAKVEAQAAEIAALKGQA